MGPILIVVLLATATAYRQENVTAGDQLPEFKDRTMGPVGVLTTSYGMPIEYKDTETINSNLLDNEFFLESMSHFNRERISERNVHAKGAGARGYFEVTHDVTDICKAKLFSAIGKRTPLIVRFSPVVQNLGGADTTREVKGFAVKFYTEEGNWDLVGLNTDVFSIKDPLYFTFFVRAFKRNPKTNLFDDNMGWDLMTSRPETLHQALIIFGDAGIPDGYRYMPGFGIHTFEVANEHGDKTFVRFHILPDAGIRNLTSEEATRIAGEDADYSTRDLYNAIANGEYPSYTLSIQIATLHDVEHAKFDLFDITKRWPVYDYPLHPVGRIVLNKNVKNYFAEIEQLSVSPGNLVPGILGGVDKIFEARRLSYRDIQNYRLGPNFNKIDVNRPQTEVHTYNRDGLPYVKDNEKDKPNYYPNSFNGPLPYLDKTRPALLKVYTDPRANNFDQAAEYYNQMTEGERSRLAANIVASLGNAVKNLQEKSVKLLTLIDPDLGKRIAQGLLNRALDSKNVAEYRIHYN